MRLVTVPIHGSTPLVFTCRACGRKVSQSHEPVIADLDGAAYEAYYCKPCATQYAADVAEAVLK